MNYVSDTAQKHGEIFCQFMVKDITVIVVIVCLFLFYLIGIDKQLTFTEQKESAYQKYLFSLVCELPD